MKQKTKEALKSVLKDVAKHEAEDGGPDVTVDLGELKRLLRWAQDKSYVWFKGDRVERTGASVPFAWLNTEEQMLGTVVSDSGDDGIVLVDWDGGPQGDNRVTMYHNEIKLAK